MKFITPLTTAAFVGLSVATDTKLTVQSLVDRVKTVELERNLYNFHQIAKKNGGNRAFGWPGYEASAKYILERAVTRFGNQFDTYIQNFTHLYEQTIKIEVTGPDGDKPYVITSMYNTPNGPDGATALLVDTPVDDTRGSGCFEDQWTGVDVVGKIALVKRGTCAIANKLKLAKIHGAVGVILWNNVPGDSIVAATLSAENAGLMVPVGTVRQAVGLAWKARLAAGEALTVTLLVDGFLEPRQTFNVISETKEGDPNNVIFIGAHLDSVQQGPGVNDDGSGSTALLEILTGIRYFKGYKNKVRFAWWGAEEAGLAGSWFYTRGLSEEDADKIRLYLNFDMIGSIVPDYHVYLGTNPGDSYGAEKLYNYLIAAGKPAEYVPFGTSSDYLGFITRSIPSSGIFTGAGAPQDPCYHLACDTTANINSDALTTNSKAAAAVVAELALSDLADLPRRAKVSSNPKARSEQRNQLAKMKRAAEVAAHAKSCSHDGEKNIY